MSYAVPVTNRIYLSFFLCLCASFLFVSSVEAATTLSPEIQRMLNEVSREVNNNINRPAGSTLSTAPSAPTITKNASGGLSATTNNILKTLDRPSNFSSTSNYSLGSAKNALKTCVRSPACAGRAMGAGGVIYGGIQGWKDVYDFVFNEDTGNFEMPSDPNDVYEGVPEDYQTSYVSTGYIGGETGTACGSNDMVCVGDPFDHNLYGLVYNYCTATRSGFPLMGNTRQGENRITCYYGGSGYNNDPVLVPAPLSTIDDSIDDSYIPEISDAPIVLESQVPATIDVSTPAPVQLPSTTTTSTNSQGQTITTISNQQIMYTVLNNNTASPSIESAITETTTTYDDTANVIGTTTSTTTNNAVTPDQQTPTPTVPEDPEFPHFCTWAKTLCNWLNWTQEPFNEEDPDFSNLIVDQDDVIEEYEFEFSAAAQCPEPIVLNLSVINKTVEIKYDLLCSYLLIIKPIILTAAWILAAFIYLGVLRRG